jgi:hypothetical protein
MRYQTVKLEEGVDPASITEVQHTRQKDEILTPEEAFVSEEDREEEGPMEPAEPAQPEAQASSPAPEEAGAEGAAPIPVDPAEEKEDES